MDQHSLPRPQRRQSIILHYDVRRFQSRCGMDHSRCTRDNRNRNQQWINESSRISRGTLSTRNRRRWRHESLLRDNDRVNTRTRPLSIFVLYPPHPTDRYHDWPNCRRSLHRLCRLDMGILFQLHLLRFGDACYSICGGLARFEKYSASKIAYFGLVWGNDGFFGFGWYTRWSQLGRYFLSLEWMANFDADCCWCGDTYCPGVLWVELGFASTIRASCIRKFSDCYDLCRLLLSRLRGKFI